MAPLVWGERETKDQMLWYTVVLIALTLLPLAFGAFGWIYGVSALLLGGRFLRDVIAVRSAADYVKPSWRLYGYSLLYLALIFVAMAVDRQI
jgi:protoheme IX farnesyltransferase